MIKNELFFQNVTKAKLTKLITDATKKMWKSFETAKSDMGKPTEKAAKMIDIIEDHFGCKTEEVALLVEAITDEKITPFLHNDEDEGKNIDPIVFGVFKANNGSPEFNDNELGIFIDDGDGEDDDGDNECRAIHFNESLRITEMSETMDMEEFHTNNYYKPTDEEIQSVIDKLVEKHN